MPDEARELKPVTFFKDEDDEANLFDFRPVPVDAENNEIEEVTDPKGSSAAEPVAFLGSNSESDLAPTAAAGRDSTLDKANESGSPTS